MPEEAAKPLEKLDELVRGLGLSISDLVLFAVVAIVALVVLYLVWKAVTRRKRVPPVEEPDLSLDVATLGESGPSPGPPVVEFYNIPVRLTALVLAPAGRGHELPPPERLNEVIDAIVPGMAQVVAAHRPLFRRWPAQLSSSGFAHAFFVNARLPGNGGKGTPWSSVAGTVKIEGQSVMAGLILRADRANGYGHEIIESEGQWLRILQIKLE